MTDVRPRTFSASSGAGPRPWRVLLVAVPGLVVAVYFLEPLVVGAVAAVTAAITVPLAIRHRRAESTSEVDVSDELVVYRRRGRVLAKIDRRSPAFEVVAFTDTHGLAHQLLLTDGVQHARLVAGQWREETLHDLASAASAASAGAPRVASWGEVKAEHPAALAWWERHATAIIVGAVVGIPALVIVGGVLAVLLFDLG